MASPTRDNVKVWPNPQNAPSSEALVSFLILLSNVVTATTWLALVVCCRPTMNPIVRNANV